MEVRKLHSKRTIFNVTLSKVSGLYQILDSESTKLGNHNAYGVVNMVFALYIFLVSAILFFNGVYFWPKYVSHKTDIVLAIVSAYTFVFSCYKIIIVVYRSNDILDCLSISRFDFTSLGHRQTRLLELWRNRSIKFTDMYAYTSYISVFLYCLCPLWFRDKLRTLIATDGSASYYRNNVMNIYIFFSAEEYNAYFFTMYLIEATCLLSFGYFTTMFDTLLAELCLSLVCQLKMINAELVSLGHEPTTNRQNPSNTDGNIESKTTDVQYEVYNDLVTIIKEHQAIIQKLEKLFSIFGNIVLSQIFVSSSTLVVVWFVMIKEFTDENIQTNPGATTVIAKMIIACPILTFELFMTLYLFQIISDEKESIVFSLYCSNWTEMDIKCRNLILLTTRMNNTHKKKLKYSRLRVVNLEMFLRTMRVGYSILSVLLKT